MVRYVIEKLTQPKPDQTADTAEATFSIIELPGRKKVGTLRRTAQMFTAESNKHRNTSEASRGLLVLKMAFRSDHFYTEHDGVLQKLREEDLL